MRLCTTCLDHDDRNVQHCPSCRSDQFATLTSKGYVTALPAGAGMPCQSCFATTRPLRLRYCRLWSACCLSTRSTARPDPSSAPPPVVIRQAHARQPPLRCNCSSTTAPTQRSATPATTPPPQDGENNTTNALSRPLEN